MLEVTNTAQEVIKRVLTEQQLEGPVRIFLDQGCAGAQLGMGVDEARPNDRSVELDGLTFVLDQGLADMTGGITVDYVADATQPGFTLTPEKALQAPEGCGGGCCGC
jgi:Fe-S cluster assembly iron-binding protein IscA